MKVTHLGFGIVVAACCVAAVPANGVKTVRVTGTGFDGLTGALVHSKRKTAAGSVQRSTEIVELDGDLRGRVLYQVTSVFDDKAGTMVNTGNQVFSGTIDGSAPVMLGDSRFRFYVNFKTGAEYGSVYLTEHIAGPPASCILHVTGTGRRRDGNPTFKYAGTCAL